MWFDGVEVEHATTGNRATGFRLESIASWSGGLPADVDYEMVPWSVSWLTGGFLWFARGVSYRRRRWLLGKHGTLEFIVHTVGRHLIAEYYGCDCSLLNDVDAIRLHMLAAAEAVRVTVIGEIFHRYAPQGVSGTILIAESHLSIHTWPESGYAAVDIFTCGDVDPRPGFDVLAQRLNAESLRMQEIIRGIDDHITDRSHLLPEDVQILNHTSDIRCVR